MSEILHLQERDWPAIQASGKPVLLDFWAEWCRPCHMLAPVFKELATRFGEQVQFAKVNVDESPEIANRFGIRSIPTLVMLRGGKELDRVVGVRSLDDLARFVEGHLSMAAGPRGFSQQSVPA